jgi:hypothetical protein
LFDWARRQTETGKDGFLPIIQRDRDRNSYRVDRVAFTDKKKLRLSLNPDETQLFNISARRFDKSIIAVPFQGTRIVLALSQVKTHINISRGEIPNVVFHISAKGFLEESPPNFLNGDVSKIESQLQTEFNGQLQDLLYKIRNSGVDPYGFGLHYLAKYFGKAEDWNRWKNAYPQITFRVKSRIVIDKAGLVE